MLFKYHHCGCFVFQVLSVIAQHILRGPSWLSCRHGFPTMHMHRHVCLHTPAHSHIQAHTCALAHTDMHIHTHHLHRCLHNHTYMSAYMGTHTQTPANAICKELPCCGCTVWGWGLQTGRCLTRCSRGSNCASHVHVCVVCDVCIHRRGDHRPGHCHCTCQEQPFHGNKPWPRQWLSHQRPACPSKATGPSC